MGATDSVDWEYAENVTDVVQKLQNEGVFVASIEQAELAVNLNDFSVQKEMAYAVIFGNEVKGVQQKVVTASDVVIEIPQFGGKRGGCDLGSLREIEKLKWITASKKAIE